VRIIRDSEKSSPPPGRRRKVPSGKIPSVNIEFRLVRTDADSWTKLQSEKC